MIDFIINNWIQLLPIVLLIASILVLLIKRKIKIQDNDLLGVIMYLPSWIDEAEDLYPVGHGIDKFAYVFNSAINALKIIKNCSSDELIRRYGEVIRRAIEDILSTPKKKEVKR